MLRNIFYFVTLLFINLLIKRQYVKINNETLLIIRLDSIGDYIMFRNFLSELRNDSCYMNYKITLCGNIIWKDLAEYFDSNIIDDFIWINRNLFLHNLSYKYKALKMIYERGFEVVIDTIYSREILFGDIIVKASGAKERIGSKIFEKFSKFKTNVLSDRFYTKLIPVSKTILFEFERNKEFFRNLLGRDINVTRPELDTTRVSPGKNIKNKYIVIHPGASRPNKMWDTRYFKDTAEFILSNYSFDIAVSGSKQEEYLFARIISLDSKNRFINFFGNSLTDLAKLISEAEFLISNDTSTIHFAAAVSTPFICIADGFSYNRFYPYPKHIFEKGHYLFPKNFIPGKENNLNNVPPEEVKSLVKNILTYS